MIQTLFTINILFEAWIIITSIYDKSGILCYLSKFVVVNIGELLSIFKQRNPSIQNTGIQLRFASKAHSM